MVSNLNNSDKYNNKYINSYLVNNKGGFEISYEQNF